MAKVEIYTSNNCPYCVRAKALLDRKGVVYSEYNISGDAVAIDKMVERTGGFKSVPQIFIDGKHVGGCDDIHALDAKGELDSVLQ